MSENTPSESVVNSSEPTPAAGACETPSYFSRRWDNSGSTEESSNYKSVCGSAIVCCVIAALSPLAFFHPFLWLIPAIAVGVGVWALTSIARQPDELLGGGAVRWALAVAVFCSGAAITDWFAYRVMLKNEAVSFVNSWFDLILDDRPLEGYQLLSHPLNRRLPGRGLETQFSSGGKNREEFDLFMSRESMKILSDPDLHASYKFVKPIHFYENEFRETVMLNYEISWDGFDGRKTKTLVVSAARMKLVDVPLTGWMLLGVTE